MAAGGVINEDLSAEQPALEWLQELGWGYEHGPDIAPGTGRAERGHWSDVVLAGRLARAVRHLNPDLTADAVRRAVELVMTSSSSELILDHQDLHELLLQGVPVSYTDKGGVERDVRARLIDWENPGENDLLAVNQFTVIAGKKNRRPDILLFVNGLPLGQIELKNPADEQATPESAVNQVAHYRMTIPRLYRFVEIIGVSDLITARLGTITTPAEHFAEWKSMDRGEDEGRSELEVMLRGAFGPVAFLDLVRNFVLFEANGPRTWKVMAKYHQVHAVNRAVEETDRAMSRGELDAAVVRPGGREDKRAGVVWHTQGAGKSYTMVFYATKLRRDPRFGNPTIIGLTDRRDLDDQIFQTFLRQKHLSPVRADRIRGAKDGLYELLDRPAGGIIFTTIQKFQPPAEQRAQALESERASMPVLCDRANVIVMADEAHRTEYGQLAANLTQALPNAVRIGFTGTPIEKADKNTRLTFGEYISIYRMAQAQEDRATVPIYYESRQVPVSADAETLAQVEEVLEDEEPEAASKLVTAWARLEPVVGAPERLDKVAADIHAHYSKRVEGLAGKAIVVGYSRRICAELTERLQGLLGEQAVTCVMTAQATEDPALSKYRRNKQEMRDVEVAFKDPDNELRVVVVRDMWLTGFDVPCLHTLYIDKPMRDHGLLQAIARVNRAFRDKPGGLVVDYIGIGEDLRDSLTAYSADDIDDVVVPLTTAIVKMREKHEILCDLLHGIDWRPAQDASAGERATQLANATKQALDRFVATREETVSFLDTQSSFASWLALVGPDPAAIALRNDAGFFALVAKQLRQLAPTEAQASKAAEQAVKQFFSTGLGAGEIVDVFALSGEERPEISVLSDEFLDNIAKGLAQPNLQVAFLRKLLQDQIRTRLRSNQIQARKFGEEVRKVLDHYEAKQITAGEVVAALVELAKRLRDAGQRNEQMGLSDEEAAFYDALAGDSDDWVADPTLKAIAADLVRQIRKDLSVDWTSRKNTEAEIRVKVKRLLRRHNYKPPAKAQTGGEDALDLTARLILDQARSLYRYWPEVDSDAGQLFQPIIARRM